MTRRPFAPAEDDLIVAQYAHTTIRTIAAQLGRPWQSVQGRIYRLQKAGRLSVADRYWHRPWTEDDITYLMDRYGQITDAAIAQHLHRTPVAVDVHAGRLGLRKSDNLWTARTVARLFGVDAKTVTRWAARGWVTAHRSATRFGGGRGWDFDDESLEQFVRTHGWAYDWRRMEPGEYLTNLARQVAKDDPWLTVDEAAVSLGWSYARVDRWVKQGLLAHKRRPKQSQHGPWQNQRMIRKADLPAFLARYREVVHAHRSASARERMLRRYRQEVAA